METANLRVVGKRGRVGFHQLLRLRLVQGLDYDVWTNCIKCIVLVVRQVVPPVDGSTPEYAEGSQSDFRTGGFLDIFDDRGEFLPERLSIIEHKVEVLLGETLAMQ